ncbi:MAG: hypothetical protein COA78_03745 [Blastopirellula sp.]|nr:MAG: hypothetical protein COA78_03745 [Blastopirellula sp.]
MNIEDKFWDSKFGNSRTAEDWNDLFYVLHDSLEKHLGFPVHVEHLEIDDEVDAKQSSVGSSIRIPVSNSIDLTFVGSLTLSVNHGQSVSADALLLMYCCGKRMSEHKYASELPSEALLLQFIPRKNSLGEWSHRLCLDESGEWEEYMTLDDWNGGAT